MISSLACNKYLFNNICIYLLAGPTNHFRCLHFLLLFVFILFYYISLQADLEMHFFIFVHNIIQHQLRMCVLLSLTLTFFFVARSHRYCHDYYHIPS